jgi:hypothetical protein
VLLRRAGLRNTAIKLKSSNAGVVTIPAEVTIPQGQDKTTFQVATRPVAAETSVEISASYGGLVRSATLKVVP